MTSALIRLAEHQHGVVATWQLRELGMDSRSVHRLAGRDGWERLTRTVLRREDAPRGASQRVAAAVLDAGPGAILSHESAAAWWGHRGSQLERPVHVTSDRTTSRTTGLARVHRVRRIDERWITDVAGVAVARPELVAMQAFATQPAEHAARLVDSLWSQRRLSRRSLTLLLDDLGERGRNGIGGLRHYLEERATGQCPPDLSLESRAQEILDAAGLPLDLRVDPGEDTAWSGRVDFCHRLQPLVLEIQSELHHTSLTDRAADAVRIARLAEAGVEVVEVTDEMVWSDPGAVVDAVRTGLDRLARRRHPSALGPGSESGSAA